MLYKIGILQILLSYSIISPFAFDDFFVNGDISQDIIEQGRAQYQMLKDRGNLPQYGDCWKSAVEHINEGCRYLSEETQSDIALHITNCFLEMSGHETYNCGLDKKPNLRSICISSMSDRAFNVYTEFYTHTQSICWFLRGQIWHETISENTFKVGKQLEESSKNQEHLLETQKESLTLQQKMLEQGKFLEQVLEDLYISVKGHQELINVMASSLSKLQTWVVGEISWVDSLFFHISTILLIFTLTSTKRTNDSRLILFLLMFINFILERFLCGFISYFKDEPHVDVLYSHIYNSVWYSRYIFVCLATSLFFYKTYKYEDITDRNNKMLLELSRKSDTILDFLQKRKSVAENGNLELENETEMAIRQLRNSIQNRLSKTLSPNVNNVNNLSYTNKSEYKENTNRYSNFISHRYNSPLSEISNGRYNLRSRTATPDSIHAN